MAWTNFNSHTKTHSKLFFSHLLPRTPLQATLAYGAFLLIALALPVALGSTLTPSDTHAGTDTAGSTSGYYVSVTSSDTLSLNVNAVPGGVTASTHDTLSVSSNTPNGYKVYLSTPTNTAKSNYLCPAGITPSDTDCFTPASSAATLTNFAANTWGYSMNDSTYQKVPLFGSGAAIINKTSATSESGVQTPIYFGLKADMALPSDTYTGTIMYTAIADTSGTNRQTTISPTSTENIDGGDTLTVTIPYISSRPESEIKSSTSITIGGTSCPVQTITKITSPYTGIQATCTMPAKAAGTYTVSVSISQAGGGSQQYTASESLEYINPVQYMQDIATICPTLSVDNPVTLVDSRDDQEYAVFKAKDGNCWMGENLRFGINPDGTAHPFTNADIAGSDSNLNSTKMLDLTYDSSNPRNAGRIKNSSKYMMTADGSDNAFYSNTESYTEPYINIYQANDTGYEVDPSGWASAPDKDYKFGVLYNYCAATGGTACTASGTTPTVSGSVCPKGWTLPSYNQPTDYSTTDKTTDGSRKDLMNLRNNYGAEDSATGANVLMASPLSFVRSGAAYNRSLDYRSSSGYGYYWSSTVEGGYRAYRLTVGSIAIGRYDYSRYYGLSVRCVSL